MTQNPVSQWIRCTALTVVLTFAATALAQPLVREPLVIGDTFTIESRVLDEQRRINVYMPAAYEGLPDQTFPVLYMPDGGVKEDFLHLAGLVQISTLNWTMRPFVLVGIENTQRRRDLTGPTTVEEDRNIAPEVGGSAKFRAFLRDELIPVIDATYRTTAERAIIGESLAGLFVVETLLEEPDLFDTYLAVDPSLWWDNERLVDTALAQVTDRVQGTRALFLAASNAEGIREPTARLAGLLSEGAPQIRVVHSEFPDETHSSVFHPAAIVGLRSLLPRPAESN